MKIRSIKRIAAKKIGIGKNRVWLNPLRINEIKEAITNQDVNDLIKDGAIKAKAIIGRKTRKKRSKTRRGAGKIKMTVKRSKKRYMMRIRKLRKFIKLLKESSIITSQESKKLRSLSKAGHFKSQRYLKEYVTGVMKKDISKLEKK